MLKLILINIYTSKNYRSSITNQHANADGSEGTLAKYVWILFFEIFNFYYIIIIFFFSTLKSFQEEFFDETNENIISMFDLLLNVESNGNSENNDLRNQSTTRITNVRRYVLKCSCIIFFKLGLKIWKRCNLDNVVLENWNFLCYISFG